MFKQISHHAVAFGLAALMTLGVLGSLGSLADTQYQAAQTTLAQANAAAAAKA
jgi:uncharacterized membrane protein